MGSLCQGGAKEIASGLELGVVEVHHGVLCDFGGSQSLSLGLHFIICKMEGIRLNQQMPF